MSQPTVLDDTELTMPDGSQGCNLLSQDVLGADQEPMNHKPEGENVFSMVQLPFDELQGPAQKKPRLHKTSVQSSEVTIPTQFRVKWLQSATHGLVPFVRHEETQIVHCGLAKMQVFSNHDDGIATVLCMKGCHWSCPGHTKGHCGCHCHMLQWHYSSRGQA